MSERLKARLKNKIRIRRKVTGTVERPRLTVFRSSKYIYAQLVDDVNGATLASVSSSGISGLKGTSNCDAAKSVGAKIAEIAKGKNIEKVVFDRNGYVYHGKVKALAEGAREAGLQF
ncbi:MAG: 50S ribosomal protein L18 [Bdellovibrionaceae bacterium]|nr:50S ribosomal protein L18 [Pseudobdellovibrionaceae bacterium]